MSPSFSRFWASMISRQWDPVHGWVQDGCLMGKKKKNAGPGRRPNKKYGGKDIYGGFNI